VAATSFKIRGIEPPDLKDHPAAVRKLYWGWVVEYGLKRKDLELSKGLDKDGKPLRPLRPKTRRYRRSAMTPTGKGDPSDPPLTPGHRLSRTRSLLAGRALTTHAEFYWRFDAFTGDSWGVVLAYQKKKGRDVFGLSPKGTAWVQRMALKRWERYKAGQAEPVRPARVSPGLPTVGSHDMTHTTTGIGSADTSTGRWTGGMTWPEWRRYFTAQAKAIPGRPAGPSNRLLGHVWGVDGRSGGAKAAKPRARPPGPPATKVAMAPRPPRPLAEIAKPVPPAPAPTFAELVRLAVHVVPEGRLFGDNKAWVHHVWEEYLKLPGSRPLSLEAFKALLTETLETRVLLMAGDLAVVRHPAEAARAETSYLSTMFHFVKKIFRR
jgi:hypothetical protein